MIARTRTLAALPALACASLAAAQSASFTVLDGVSGANDLTPDGRVLVGSLSSGGAYYWTLEDGLTSIGGRTARAVSDDGSVIFGNVEDPGPTTLDVPAIWTDATGWQEIGTLPGAIPGCGSSLASAYELSADGDVAVGLGWMNGCDAHGFRWTPDDGILPYESLANGSNRASVVSGDGEIAAGFAQGNFSRTPARWFADGTGELLDPTGDTEGEVQGITDDGTVLMGNWEGEAFFWTEQTGPVLLGSLFPTYTGIAMDVDNRGNFVGFDINLGARFAWIRPVGGVFRRLGDYFTGLGATVPLANLEVAQAISTDGRVIIGHGFTAAWIAHICFEDLSQDHTVGVPDLLQLLAAWGPCAGCPEDLNGDDAVDTVDLLELLAHWGDCPSAAVD